jgi:acyl-CoA thioesterase YciA
MPAIDLGPGNGRRISVHASDTSEQRPREEPALRAVAMPADANPHGDIFGGWLLSQMDLAGTVVATRRAKGRTVTVAITAMTFHRPVFIGDEVSCYAKIIKVGRTSITVKVESFVRRGLGEEQIEVTEGIFTYVAVGDDRKPCLVPPEG